MKELLINIALNLAGYAIASLLIYLVWNAIMPELFAFPTITYLQAAGFRLIAKCLTIATGDTNLNEN